MKKQRWEVRLVGQGGQGVALAGIILAEAAVRDGKNAVMNHTYGAQKRGGPSQADVVISGEEIDYPKV
ncbi:MAG: 2-oxoacid:acceptor oxidoreductase family protein, partial [Dehalococcoidia bacterium]|nr:2-oxoacid:acceptor oxidoreductase family protein [Dehalococcoidia bacterium]